MLVLKWGRVSAQMLDVINNQLEQMFHTLVCEAPLVFQRAG